MVCVRGGEGGPLYSANRSVPALNKYGNIVHRLVVDQSNLPAKVEVGWCQSGAGRPCGSGSPWVPPLMRPFILDIARWAPNLCMSVPGLCTSVFYVKWASFGCVTEQRCFVYLCCVFCVFSCYSRLVSLQSTIHQHSWNSLVITPTTTIVVHSSCLYAGIVAYILHLRTVNKFPHT